MLAASTRKRCRGPVFQWSRPEWSGRFVRIPSRVACWKCPNAGAGFRRLALSSSEKPYSKRTVHHQVPAKKLPPAAHAALPPAIAITMPPTIKANAQSISTGRCVKAVLNLLSRWGSGTAVALTSLPSGLEGSEVVFISGSPLLMPNVFGFSCRPPPRKRTPSRRVYCHLWAVLRST